MIFLSMLSIKHVSISEFVYLDKWGLFKLKVKKISK